LQKKKTFSQSIFKKNKKTLFVMLNRHHLRVKAMQALYAFENTREAEFDRSRQHIYSILEPTWTEKDYINEDTLAEQRQDSQKYFLEYHNNENGFLALNGLSSKVRNATLKGIQYYKNAVRLAKENNHLNLVKNTEKLYEIYIKFLKLAIELTELVANEKIAVQNSHIRKYEERGDFKMEKNLLVQALKKNDKLHVLFSQKNITWEKEYEFIRDWYITQLKADEKYQAYHLQKGTSFEQDKEIILHIFSNIIFGKKSVYNFSVKDCSIHYKIPRKMIEKYALEGTLRIIENAVNNIARSFLTGVSEEQENQKEEDKLANMLTFRLKQKTDVIRKDAFKSAQRKERAIKQGEIFKEGSPENIIEHSIKAIVEAFSQYLSENYLHDVANYPKNVNAISQGISKLFDVMDVEWNDDDVYILLQTHHDTINSQMFSWGNSQLLHWDEDVDAIQNMIIKTIKNVENELHSDFELHQITRNWGEDKAFMQDLYNNAIKNEVEYEGYIQEKSQNWHISRLARIDKSILKIALSELINMYSIPIKVSINEYIEISKEYSTPKSKNFINGLLDTLSKDLVERKIIRKSGLGMIDNK
jgi:transcription antitermination factor NusB